MKEKYYKYGREVFKISDSPRNKKQLVAEFKDGTKIHFGASLYPEFPNTKRGDNYCKRSYGIGKKYNSLKDIKTANTLSRIVLWKCKGEDSLSSYKKAGLKLAKKEEFFNSI